MAGPYPFITQAAAGHSIASMVTLDEDPVVTIKASAGTIKGWHFYNPSNAVAYVQFFNAAAATPGTTTPTFVVGIPTLGVASLAIPGGIPMSTAILVCATTGPTTNGAPSADIVGVVIYE